MFIRIVFMLALTCTLIVGRPQDPAAVPAAADGSATGNSDVPSVLNPDAPTDAPTDASTDAPVPASSETASQDPTTDQQPATDASTAETSAADAAPVIADAAVPSAGSDGVASAAPKEWQLGATYQMGEQVSFGGDIYRAVSQHNAAAFNWTPPQAPALWTKI